MLQLRIEIYSENILKAMTLSYLVMSSCKVMSNLWQIKTKKLLIGCLHYSLTATALTCVAFCLIKIYPIVARRMRAIKLNIVLLYMLYLIHLTDSFQRSSMFISCWSLDNDKGSTPLPTLLPTYWLAWGGEVGVYFLDDQPESEWDSKLWMIVEDLDLPCCDPSKNK